MYLLTLLSITHENLVLQTSFVFVFLAFQLRYRRAIILHIVLLLVFFLMSYWYPKPSLVIGEVVEIHADSMVVETDTQRIAVNKLYHGNLGDRVKVTGELKKRDTAINRLKYHVNKAEIELLEEGTGIKTKVWKYLSVDQRYKDALYGVYNDESTISNSLSLQLSGFQWLIAAMITPLIGREKSAATQKTINILFTLIFGLTFNVVRIYLKTFKNKETQIIILLLLYPNATRFVSFWLSFGVFLIHSLSHRFEKIPRVFTQFLVSLRIRYQYSLIEHILYPLTRVLHGLLFITALSAPIYCKPFDLVYFILESYYGLLNQVFFRRFLIVGMPNIMVLLLVLCLAYIGKKRILYLSSCLLVLVMIYFPFARYTFVDVGQGDASVIQQAYNSHTTVIDTGRSHAYYTLRNTLYKLGIRKIDQLVITHEDGDHSENMHRLVRDFGGQIITEKGESVDFFIPILGENQYEDINGNSIILLSYTGVLFMGDAGIHQEFDIISKYDNLSVKVLKCGHHGSKTSSALEFLKHIKARYAIISSKPSVYGHPHASVLRSLYNTGTSEIQTSQEGTITIIMTPFYQFINTSRGMFDIIDLVIK